MKNVLKVAFLTSIITAALTYVVLEWRPLMPETSRPPEVSWASSPAPATPASAPGTPLAPPASGLSDDERNNIDIYRRVGPGVVNVTSTTVAYDFFLREIPVPGTGSGAVIDTDGRIVTNHHVIENARRIEVTLWDKSKYLAKIVGDDPYHDLAVIQIDAPKDKLKPIPLGTSKGLMVGQKVLAIGNPYALDRTLTTGIISSLGRSIQVESDRIMDDVIQTDASINPGNSGGPLLNTAGEIIGINTAIYTPTSEGGSVGIAFAIPADTVREISGDLIKLGRVPHPYLGVVRPIELGNYQGMSQALRLNTDRGLMVTTILENSPAARAGIRGFAQTVIIGNYKVPTGGDVILSIEGRDVNAVNEMNSMIEKFKPGDNIKVTVLRDGRKIDIPVTLLEEPHQ